MEAWMNDVPRAVVESQRELRASIPDLAGRYAKLTEALRDEVAAVRADDRQAPLARERAGAAGMVDVRMREPNRLQRQPQALHLGAQPRQQRQAVQVGQLDVHQNQVWLVFAGNRQRRQTLAGLQGLVTLGFEQIMKELHVQLVVFDNHYLFGHLVSLGPQFCMQLQKF